MREYWLHNNGVIGDKSMCPGHGVYCKPRRVAVLDPEDREQVERLREAASRWADRVPYLDMREPGDLTHLDAFQAALREFADPKPPRPEEPPNWLAVVEDSKGVEWYRWSVRPKDREQAWISVFDEGRCYPTAYADLTPVRVLSPGVTGGDE
jgi:hypothetical protein